MIAPRDRGSITLYTSKVRTNTCPHCGYETNGATGNGPSPSYGDVSICIRCQGVSIFDLGLVLRKLTPDEDAEIAGHDLAQKFIAILDDVKPASSRPP